MTTLIAATRRAWRQLTSMRTALVLLFLLAIGAIPGSVLPQRNIAQSKVTDYFRTHPGSSPWLDRLGLFDVYSSPWFSAIYLLLFVSLVGCLVPRFRAHAVALIRKPPPAPSRLSKLPAYQRELPPADPDELARLLRGRRFRVTTGDGWVSGEKGYLKETGNLLFHFALLALLVGVAFGKWYGWQAERLVVAGPDTAFCDTASQFDEFGPGAAVDPADLPRFCLQLDDFRAGYLANGQPSNFDALLTLRENGRQRPVSVSVNNPLRHPGANVYLITHGYAPILRYTDRYGRVQTVPTPFLPDDAMFTSHGVAAYPDANIDPKTGKRDDRAQVGFTGIYFPTADIGSDRSTFPAERNPLLVLHPYVGDLGFDAGTPLSVYTLDQRQIDAGRLKPFGDELRMKIGDRKALPDGSTVEFLGTSQWVVLQLRHDPGQPIVLGGAAALLIGLLGSLSGKRRRVFFRIDGDGVTAGGLPRSDYPGFRAEFDDIVAAARTIRVPAQAAPAEPVPVPDREER